MTERQGFQPLAHGHTDIVLALDYNLYGDRLVTASADHRLKVFERKGDTWAVLDAWRAHDAEITDVKWNAPFSGSTIGSVGEDGYVKLWQEDLSQLPRSMKRFKSIINPILTKSRLPWCSLDFKNINTETYLALITREGNLSIMEPRDHDNLGGEWIDWMQNQDFVVTSPPAPSEETSFKVCFHKEKLPCWSAVAAGLDRKALSLAVASMNNVKIYRTDRERNLYLAAEIKGAKDLVRDVAWANGSMRGFDLIATASKDGMVRVYELHTELNKEVGNGEASSAANDASEHQQHRSNISGIGAKLTKAGRDDNQGSDSSRVRQSVALVSELGDHRAPVWRVAFSFAGDVLISTGDDGKGRTWKRGIDKKWHEYAEINAKT